MLQQLAGRWSAVLRASDTLSRLGGDEFIVLLPTTDSRGADVIAQRLRATIDDVFDIEGHPLHVSVGLAVDTGGQADANTLMNQADEAMYRVKRARHDDTAPEG
jgi:diguanylate cyclase (GGDEF)-like protein